MDPQNRQAPLPTSSSSQTTPPITTPPKKHTFLWICVGIIVLLVGIVIGIFIRR